MKEIVGKAISNPTAIESETRPWSDDPMITVWHNTDEMTALHIVWPPEVDLFPHDHNMWAVIGVYGGREDNQFYRRLEDGRIAPHAAKTMVRKDVEALAPRSYILSATRRGNGPPLFTCTGATSSPSRGRSGRWTRSSRGRSTPRTSRGSCRSRCQGTNGHDTRRTALVAAPLGRRLVRLTVFVCEAHLQRSSAHLRSVDRMHG